MNPNQTARAASIPDVPAASRRRSLGGLLLFLLAPMAWGGMEWGGALETNRTRNIRFTYGALLDFEGLVTETTRKLYDVTGSTWKQSTAETFSVDDFELEGPYPSFGFACDLAWRYFRLQFDTSFIQPDTTTTARRDYYLHVGDEIDYNGRSYDQMKIPAGAPFSADLLGNTTELTLEFVPVGFRAGDWLGVNPAFDLGLLVFAGSYDLDAGAPTGVVQYQNPPEDFVVGGRSGGLVALGAPQWGPGVEVRFGRTGGLQLDLQVHYLFSQYDGSTSFLTTADHRDKNLEFDHRNLRFRGQVEIPLNRKLALTVGLQAQWIDTGGLISSTATDPAEILAKQERFDKEFTFKSTSVMGTAGLVF